MNSTSTNDVDQEINALRVFMEQTINEKLKKIVEKTRHIHAGFLFWEPGKKLLQKIARCLCSTPDSPRFKGWADLGGQLGLDYHLIQSIKNTDLTKEDPTSEILSAYVQREDATVDKIYLSLAELNRNDIISLTYDLVITFSKKINTMFTIPNNGSIMIPPEVPDVPLILQHLLDDDDADEKNINTEDADDHEYPVGNPNPYNVPYKKIIMLTYVGNDAEIALEIAWKLRRAVTNIGVILLMEHSSDVLAYREGLVLKFYATSDYVIPILTPNYLNEINSIKRPSNSNKNMDGHYAKFIYDLMNNEYLRSGGCNRKIRCIIPDKYFDKIHSGLLNPIFNVWYNSNAITDLATQMISSQV